MNTTTKKRAALYIRVSTEEQAKHGYSLAEQAHDLRQYAEQHGYSIVGLYADEGASARKALSRRKGLQRLLEDVQTGARIGRYFRPVNHFLYILNLRAASTLTSRKKPRQVQTAGAVPTSRSAQGR